MAFDREETLRKAEKLLRQGRLDLAIAEYQRVIDAQPSDWSTANTLGDLYVRSGESQKAIAEYYRIADHLAGEGLFPKAVALYKKVLKTKPDEEKAVWELGMIAAGQGLHVDAKAAFGTLMQRRKARGDTRGAAEAFAQLCDLDGADVKTRIAGARARVEIGESTLAVARLKAAAVKLEQQSKNAEALMLFTEASRIAPDDPELRARTTRAHPARADVEKIRQQAKTPAELKQAAEPLLSAGKTEEALALLKAAAGLDPSDADLLYGIGELELRAGNIAEGTAVLERLVTTEPARRDALVILGCSIAEGNADAGYECVEVAARAAIAADDWGAAAAMFNEFVSRKPHHIPALMRLVEICVDGELEATMYSAQAQLADAYLAAGAGVEARVISEDLVAREPWDRANIERFRDALTLLGEKDVDAIIAERLSGQSPFTSTDLRTGKTEETASSEASGGETAEIDLSEILQELKGEESAPAPPPPLETVLKAVHDEATSDPSPETAEQHYKLAAIYLDRGMEREAMASLEIAAKSVRHRFKAAGLLGTLYSAHGDRRHAIEWYERAAEAPAPNPDASHELLYDLGSALEAQGEISRALAVYLDLQAEAGNYRDLAAKLEHLSKAQMDHQ